MIGKGSYGKVLLVEKKDDKKIYAMKILKKKAMIKRNQVTHIKTERRIMELIDHPFIVKLRYAFQTPQKLYFIMDYYFSIYKKSKDSMKTLLNFMERKLPLL